MKRRKAWIFVPRATSRFSGIGWRYSVANEDDVYCILSPLNEAQFVVDCSPMSVVSQCKVSMKIFNDHSCSHSRSKRTGGKCMTITAILVFLSGYTVAELDSALMVTYIWPYKRIIGIVFKLGTSKNRHLNSFTLSNKIFIEVQTSNTVIEV